MATQPLSHLTPDEYLALDEEAEFKSEYYNGEMFPMTGSSLNHNLLTFQMGGLLSQQLAGGPCRGLGSEMRVNVPATGLYTYPDLTIICGVPSLDRNTLLNPKLIVEVLSPSTEGYDRGRKFDHYRTIESLAEYVTIAQDRFQVLVHTRQPDGRWLLTDCTRHEDIAHLGSIGCTIPLDKLYETVRFESEPPPNGAAERNAPS